MKLKYHKHSEIDKHKWDETIQNSDSPFIYAMSWYLDIVSPKWNAIISEDYEYVMPICKKLKFGLIPIITQPVLCQQLGIFSSKKGIINENIIQLFLKNIPFYYLKKTIQFNFNHQKTTPFLERKNYTLNCEISYLDIEKKYSSQTRRNLKKAKKNNLTIEQTSATCAIENFKNWKLKNSTIDKKDFESVSNTLKKIEEKEYTLSLKVMLQNVELASCVLYKHNKTLTLVLISSSPKGLKLGATTFLLNHIFKTNSSKSIIFDFEGSNITGIERFYKGFGAVKQTYYLYQKP